jgi:hypothetical protein
MKISHQPPTIQTTIVCCSNSRQKSVRHGNRVRRWQLGGRARGLPYQRLCLHFPHYPIVADGRRSGRMGRQAQEESMGTGFEGDRNAKRRRRGYVDVYLLLLLFASATVLVQTLLDHLFLHCLVQLEHSMERWFGGQSPQHLQLRRASCSTFPTCTRLRVNCCPLSFM